MLREKLSRRDMLSGAGKIAVVGAGIAVVSGGLSLFSNAEAKEKPISNGTSVVKPPWPWMKLDLQEIADEGWKGWFGDLDKLGYYTGCAYGVTSGILIPYQKKMGEKYYFPWETLSSFRGGIMGFGTICSTLIGAGIVFTLFAGPKGADVMLPDLMHWYSTTMLPNIKLTTPKTTITGKDGKPRAFKGDIKHLTISKSPICHQSVGRFMKKNGVGFNDDPRLNRCAMMTGSVAVKTAEMLNGWLDNGGKYVPVNAPQLGKVHKIPLRKDIPIAAQNNCGDCHNPISVGWRAITSRLF
ncbi:MAG: C-GCAxxG-C-C family (seleno)protein [Thermodesulfovibrionales bacterium]|nr:C-GCAxxG-C-C family (seleno)protein [Thermodesulfovibrionales bacterium]